VNALLFLHQILREVSVRHRAGAHEMRIMVINSFAGSRFLPPFGSSGIGRPLRPQEFGRLTTRQIILIALRLGRLHVLPADF